MAFLTMLPLGDLLNFGYSNDNHLLLTTFGEQFAFGLDCKLMFFFRILFSGKLGEVRESAGQKGFTRPFSIYFMWL